MKSEYIPNRQFRTASVTTCREIGNTPMKSNLIKQCFWVIKTFIKVKKMFTDAEVQPERK